MSKKLEKYKRYIFAGIIINALSIVLATALKETSGSLGTVFIAVGALLFIIGASEKAKEDKKNK